MFGYLNKRQMNDSFFCENFKSKKKTSAQILIADETFKLKMNKKIFSETQESLFILSSMLIKEIRFDFRMNQKRKMTQRDTFRFRL